MASRYAGLVQTKAFRRSHAGRFFPWPLTRPPSLCRSARASRLATSSNPAEFPSAAEAGGAAVFELNGAAATGRSKETGAAAGETLSDAPKGSEPLPL